MIASYFTLRGKNQDELNTWLKSLPIRLRGGQFELMWLKSRGKKAVLWKRGDGFIFFD